MSMKRAKRLGFVGTRFLEKKGAITMPERKKRIYSPRKYPKKSRGAHQKEMEVNRGVRIAPTTAKMGKRMVNILYVGCPEKANYTRIKCQVRLLRSRREFLSMKRPTFMRVEP